MLCVCEEACVPVRNEGHPGASLPACLLACLSIESTRTFERRTEDTQEHSMDTGGAGGSSVGCVLRRCILKTSVRGGVGVRVLL